MYRYLLFSLLLSISTLKSQELFIKGQILDDEKYPLPGAYVVLEGKDKKEGITDKDGYYSIEGLKKGVYKITVSFIGCKTYQKSFSLKKSKIININLKRESYNLQEVLVVDSRSEERKKKESLSTDIVNEDYLQQTRGGSLMESIERIAGVNTISVGSGQSKPMIRGLAFNRVLVVENGTKHAAQQWGIDHGLEIDQYGVDNIEVTKGPSSLQYGSDAIGGVVNVKQNYIPIENSLGAKLDFTAKTNNRLLGTSIELSGRKKKLYFKLRGTILDYADYKLPTDTVDIYSYRVALHDHNLRNTAGKEKDIHLSMGMIGEHFTSKLFVSNVYSKSGFFANAHGLEPRNINKEEQDKSSRDILDPFQKVNHLKVLSKNILNIKPYRINVNLAYQRNMREEWSKYVSHGYMPPSFPENLPFSSDLEREFDKSVYTADIKTSYTPNSKFELTAGGNLELQQNDISGRGFIIPKFTQKTAGIYLINKHYFSKTSILQYGLRYDYGKLEIAQYKDWYKSPIDENNPSTSDYLERAKRMNKNFSNISWSIGYNYNLPNITLKANIGKSFRMPIAKELAANGVNYHRFSYEVGNAELSPEESYQLDLGIFYKRNNFAVEVTPFLNYFSNYIYLNPSFKHDRLYGNGHQMFFYTEAEVLRYGGEFHLHYNPISFLKFGIIGEFVYSEQMSGDKKGFSLPFAPPPSIILNAKYIKKEWLFFKNMYFSADFKVTGKQTDIVPPEKITPASQVFNIGCGADMFLGKQKVKIFMQVQNLFNKKYFNHTSYYRIINIPESGRNIVLNITIPVFNKI